MLHELPTAPDSAGDWPWSKSPKNELSCDPNTGDWPRITVVTPSFNQVAYLEETIRSVLLQDYPNLEYMVIDGASTDGSVHTIRKYADWLSFWTSEPDRGQSHAINKGWSRGTGEIVAWLNSDDIYYPGALWEAAIALRDNPDAGAVYGNARFISADGELITSREPGPVELERLLERLVSPVSQPSTFIRRCVLDDVGLLDESLQFTMDYDLWIRICRKRSMEYIDKTWSGMRIHEEAKTIASITQSWEEKKRVLDKVFGHNSLPAELEAREKQIYAQYYLRVARAQLREMSARAGLGNVARSVVTDPIGWLVEDRWYELARTIWGLVRHGPRQGYWPTS